VSSTPPRVGLSLLIAWLLVSSCSVDEFRNLQRKSCTECKKEGGMCVADSFCVMPGLRDGGVDAAALGDAAYSGDAGRDAEVRVACSVEGRSEPCYTAKDQNTLAQEPCRAGIWTCQDGFFGECKGQVLPEDETCNGRDDDCDGSLDEQLGTPADCEVPELKGVCRAGQEVCVRGEPKCAQARYPQTDTCNDKDDDCDGRVDEKTEVACYPDALGCELIDGRYKCIGTCRQGQRACVKGKYPDDACDNAVVPEKMDVCTEENESSRDEDCDGQIDEGCRCENGTRCYTGSPADTQSRAPCKAGTRVCSDETHGMCTDEVTPQPETCANEEVDDDCDGELDNVPARGTNCADQSDAQGACKAGARWACVEREQVCVPAQATPEQCDGRVDEDCDGVVDNGFDLQTDAANCGACGLACAEGQACCEGRCVDVQSSTTHCARCGNTCDSGEACCDGACVNRSTNPSHCGACGFKCDGVLKGCTAGQCTKLLL
jgi:hypothetical protein